MSIWYLRKWKGFGLLWWHIHIILALKRRQKDCEFKANLTYWDLIHKSVKPETTGQILLSHWCRQIYIEVACCLPLMFRMPWHQVSAFLERRWKIPATLTDWSIVMSYVTNMKAPKLCWPDIVVPLIPELGRKKQADLCEFKASVASSKHPGLQK